MARELEARRAAVAAVNIPISGWEHLIDEWIFSERDRKIMKRKFLDGLTFGELSAEFHISISQIKRITQRGMNELIKHL